jgi:hypothetical protein
MQIDLLSKQVLSTRIVYDDRRLVCDSPDAEASFANSSISRRGLPVETTNLEQYPMKQAFSMSTPTPGE